MGTGLSVFQIRLQTELPIQMKRSRVSHPDSSVSVSFYILSTSYEKDIKFQYNQCLLKLIHFYMSYLQCISIWNLDVFDVLKSLLFDRNVFPNNATHYSVIRGEYLIDLIGSEVDFVDIIPSIKFITPNSEMKSFNIVSS